MSHEEVVAIDMDQEVTLSIRVSVGERYCNKESLSQDLTAPLFIINNVQVKDIAEKLYTRVFQIFIEKLREEKVQRLRGEQLREAYDQEREMEEEITL